VLTERDLKNRLSLILGIEEHGYDADWFAIANLSADLLRQLPEDAPQIVKAYLADSDLRQASANFARGQRSQLLDFLRS